MKTERVLAASLVLDYSLYPRHKIDDTHVLHIAGARRAGEKLPPPVVDKETRIVTDGFHRVTEVLNTDGDGAEMDVEFRQYGSRSEMLEDAIRLNSGHGSNLSPYDRVRCTVLAEEVGLSVENLARALRVPITDVDHLRTTRTMKVGKGAKITPIKQGLGHLTRQDNLTRKQAEGMGGYGGMKPTYYVNQVIRVLEHDLADWDSPTFGVRLWHLRRLLGDLDLSAFEDAVN